MKKLLSNNQYFYLVIILIIAATLRFYGLNWDQNQHLHPDERMITMVSLNIRLPQDKYEWQNIMTPQSVLNPKFFAYGNFPIYLLKISGSLLGQIDHKLSTYDGINLLGRIWSVIFDIGIIIILFLLGKKLFSEIIGIFSAFFYTISVLAIQLAHFYAVDTPLTFFILLTLYQSIRFYERPTKLRAVFVGFLFGLSLSIKTSALLLVSSIGIALAVPHIWFPHLPLFMKKLLMNGLIIIAISIITFVIFEPFALIDFSSFWSQTQEQRRMTYDPFTFPYTLQYVGKIPYIYEIKNIFLWGEGPILATLSFISIFYFTYLALKKYRQPVWAKELILVIFFWVYFFVVGNFSIGFMRYMLPIYPIFCLAAAVLFYAVFKRLPIILYSLFIILSLIWPLSFINIYSQPNTRVLATDWINKNIPLGSTIATEHWDDGLPLGTQDNYKVLELPMYEPDAPAKWDKINQILQETEYIIIASNRLYTPLQKLTNCSKLPPGRCYTQTAQYYKKLFDGSLGFKKIAEFSIYPKIPFLNIEIEDQNADESFTVYDHPKVLIFKKS
ncbi:glycosyltransferase family 39 protein [Candidatus Microgenomates bacterium]|nr:glycosyltransferase family 39 protein [Candidatus Microgenomates bacterium]